jgi:type I restriction enzyme, S subunit
MEADWTAVGLADCGEWLSGGTPPKSRPDYWEGDIPWVSPKDMNVRFIYDTQDHLSSAGAASGSKVVSEGAILLVVRSMTLAHKFQIAVAQREVAFNQDLKAICCNENVDAYFLFYSLLAKQDLILRLVDEASHGTKRLRTDALSSIIVLLPPLPEQRAIAAILGALDEKIELNWRMNETLEAMAQAIFKSWFVDFDPVRAKIEGRQPVGLHAETAALFPDSLEDSAVGQIPRGWRLEKVNEIADISRDGLNPGDYPDEVFDYYSIPAYDEGRVPRAEFGGQIKSNKFIVRPEAVLLSRLNPRIPRVWLPDVTGRRPAICSTEFLVTGPKTGMKREFLYSLFSEQSFLNGFATLVTGTSGSHQRVKPDHLLRMEVVRPSDPLVTSFHDTVAPLHKRISLNSSESATLVEMRDVLLPKLLSGEIRVKDAEAAVGAAV